MNIYVALSDPGTMNVLGQFPRLEDIDALKCSSKIFTHTTYMLACMENVRTTL